MKATNNSAQRSNPEYTGGCLCGAIRYTINGKMREVINCHCSLCRKFHGHYAAYTAVERANLKTNFGNKFLAWYRSMKNEARRGFCMICGSSLFWDLMSSHKICIAAGTLDCPTDLKTTTNIYTTCKGDYYELDEQLINHDQGLENSI